MECPKALLVEVDLRQAEWIVTAYLAQDVNMLEIVQNHMDAHVRTAELITNAPKRLIEFEDSIVGHTTDPDEISKIREGIKGLWSEEEMKGIFWPRIFSMRQCGKKCNHSLNYNMKHRRFSLETELTEREALHCYKQYHQTYPGLKRYYRMIEEELRRTNGWIENCFGYKRLFLGVVDENLLNAAYAFKPQSTVARITNLGLRGIYHDARIRRVDPILQIHDSIVNQCWPRSWEELHTFLNRIDIHMSTEIEYHGVPFTLDRDFKIGPHFGKMEKVSLEGDPIDALQVAWEKALS